MWRLCELLLFFSFHPKFLYCSFCFFNILRSLIHRDLALATDLVIMQCPCFYCFTNITSTFLTGWPATALNVLFPLLSVPVSAEWLVGGLVRLLPHPARHTRRRKLSEIHVENYLVFNPFFNREKSNTIWVICTGLLFKYTIMIRIWDSWSNEWEN